MTFKLMVTCIDGIEGGSRREKKYNDNEEQEQEQEQEHLWSNVRPSTIYLLELFGSCLFLFCDVATTLCFELTIT